MKDDWNSDCCNVEVIETNGNYYICSECGNICNAFRVFIKGSKK